MPHEICIPGNRRTAGRSLDIAGPQKPKSVNQLSITNSDRLGLMKIVFSRKGSDSGAGKIPSPIFPDESFCSLPLLVGQEKSRTRFDDLTFKGHSLGKVVHDLSKGRIKPSQRIHLDPDL